MVANSEQREIRKQAEFLAQENRTSDQSIKRVFWFPHAEEIRLVELTELIPAAVDGELHPLWFRPSPQDGLTAPSGIAMIRPDEFGKLKLPEGWQDWSEAQEL